jgi:hypothetical protein
MGGNSSVMVIETRRLEVGQAFVSDVIIHVSAHKKKRRHCEEKSKNVSRPN